MRVTKTLLSMLILFGMVTPLWAVQVFYEDFEGASVGSALVGSVAGWTGDVDPVISSTLLDSGQSLDLCAGGDGAWPVVQQGFSYTPGTDEQYVFSGTLAVPEAWDGYADPRLVASGDSTFLQAALGYGKLSFAMWEGGASSMDNLRMEVNVPRAVVTGVSQLTTPIDFKVVLNDDRTNCYWRDTGTTTWNYAGGAGFGIDLALYDTITLVGHDTGTSYSGGMDSISLESESALNPTPEGVLLQEDFDSGMIGTPVDGWNGWTLVNGTSGEMVISDTLLDSGNSAVWTGTTDWPIVAKSFSYSPFVDDVYVLEATMLADPTPSAGYSDLRIRNSATGNFLQIAFGLGNLLFGDGVNDVRTETQPITAVDVRMVVTDDDLTAYYREHGTEEWSDVGTLELADGYGLAGYDSVWVVGQQNGGIDSINLSYQSDSPPQTPGDANGDGKVDGSDVTILAGNWQKGVSDGLTATWEEGDFNGDGKVDGSDVTILAGNWQAGVTAAAASVPEPSMLVLLSYGIFFLLLRRRD